MIDDNLDSTRALLVRDFELEGANDKMSEQELIQLLADQIADMIEYNLEVLLSLMYRLDVNEQKVNAALSPGNEEPANVALAKLVFERQKQRAFTKKFYAQQELDDLEEGLQY